MIARQTVSRRSFLKGTGTIGAVAAANIAAPVLARAPLFVSETTPEPGASSREIRMLWWHQAKFGRFIHWDLYSVNGQQEWALELEAIPISEYKLLAKHFTPTDSAIVIGGLMAKVKLARSLTGSQNIKFKQDELGLRRTGLPGKAPDDPVTVIEIECENDPVIAQFSIRSQWPRNSAGIS